MQFHQTELPGVILVEPKVFADERGFFMETYHQPRFVAAGIALPFVQDNHSKSRRGVLRGLHYQLGHPQGKLVRAVQGEIFDVAVDVRRSSPTFGKWVGVLLSDANRRQLYLPPGFAHGFCVVSETAEVLYKTTDVYHPEDERTVIWNDPDIGVIWPVSDPVVSAKDQLAKRLSETECFA
jgi:dTDP-4-dehydrorhamnose 3,5-epimerase